MNRIKIILSLVLLLISGNIYGQSQRDAYIASARLYREYANRTKCPDKARVLNQYAEWNECMVKVLAGQSTGCGVAPTTPIPACEADGGEGTSTSSPTRPGTTQPQTGTIDNETIRTTVEGISELIALTKRSPEKIEAARKKRYERVSSQIKRENSLYSKRSFALTLDYGEEEQQIKQMRTLAYRSDDRDGAGNLYDVGRSFSAGANVEFRFPEGTRAGFFHTGLRYQDYANPVFLNGGKEFAKLQMKYVNIPAFISFRLFEIAEGDFVSFYPQLGFNGGYLLKASTNPTTAGGDKSVVDVQDVSDDFKKLTASALLGFRVNFWRVYVQSQFTYPLLSDLLKEDDEYYKAHRGSITNVTVGLYIFK